MWHWASSNQNRANTTWRDTPYAPKTITNFTNDYTIMPAQLVQDVDERIYRTFRDRCSHLNIDLGKAVTDALDMWLERSDYDEAFIERQRKILREEKFVSLDEI
jgi:hypothetical protein